MPDRKHAMNIENANLRLDIDRRGRMKLTDKRCGAVWESLAPLAALRLGATDREPGRRAPKCAPSFSLAGDSVRGQMRCPRPEEGEIEANFDLTLDGDRLQVTLHPLRGIRAGEIVEIELPRGLGWAPAGGDGHLVLPLGIGALCDFSPRRPAFYREWLNYSGGQTGISLPIFGTVRDGNALTAIADTPFDCKFAVALNRGKPAIYAITPVWVIEEHLNTERRVHYVPQPGGDYVSIAKRYRRELIERGEYVSLRQKGQGCPEVELTMGAVLGHRWMEAKEPEGADPYDQRNAYGFFRRAARLGFDRVVAHNPSWQDPADARLAADFVRSLSPGFHLSVYLNHVDIFRPGELPQGHSPRPFPDWDEGLVARDRNGELRRNWRVRRKGQPDIWTLTVCSARRLEVARPQYRTVVGAYGRGSVYVDVEGAIPLYQCFSASHPVTREQDCKYRLELLGEAKRTFGIVSTEAAPIACVVPAVEVGSYFSLYQFSGHGNSLARILPPMIPIPLHPLVFHGSVVNQTAVGDGYYQCHPPHVALYGFLPDTFDDQGLRVSYQMRNTCYAELLEHKFLTRARIVINENDSFQCDDVQYARFSDGTVVIGNFASVPYQYEGHTIAPMDFLILREGVEMGIGATPAEVIAGQAVTVLMRLRNTGEQPIVGGRVTALLRGACMKAVDLPDAELPTIAAGEEVQREWSLPVPGDAVPGDLVVVVTAVLPGDGEPRHVTELAHVLVKAAG